MIQINPVENFEPNVKQQNFLTHASKDCSLTRQLLSSAKLLTPFNEPPKRQSRVNHIYNVGPHRAALHSANIMHAACHVDG